MIRTTRFIALAALVVSSASMLLSVVLFKLNDDRAKQTAREGIERRDQICDSNEREDRGDIVKLQRTYEYLVSLTPRQRQSPLNEVILRSLPETENTARERVAPKFCSDPGVGLPGAGPKVPDRPRLLIGR